MKHRDPAFKITPISIYGAKAPAIIINADDSKAALKEASKKSTLFKRFPETWRLIDLG